MKCRQLSLQEANTIFEAMCNKYNPGGKYVVMCGSHNVSNELIEDFCLQVGICNPQVAEWQWNTYDEDISVYYTDVLDEGIDKECIGALYTMIVHGIDDMCAIAELDLYIACETPRCIIFYIGESYESDNDSKMYKCKWCGASSVGSQWVYNTTHAHPGEYTEDWDMNTADGGDSIECPMCGGEHEVSELDE